MKQVIQSTRTGKLALREVPAPQVRGGCVLVRTRASLISAGTDRMLMDFAKKSLAAKARQRPDLVKKVIAKAKRDGVAATMRAVLARLDEPLPLGYSAAGEVVAVGAGLEGVFRVGQRVAVAGAGLANHAELNVVPRNLVAAVPDDVPDEEACYATLGAIALHAVRNAEPALGAWVAVIGCGLLGQLAVQLLRLAGARVLALDVNAERLALARRLGAEAALDPAAPGLEAAVQALTGGLGCDGVVVAAATKSSEPLQTAAAIARDRARIVMVGMTGTAFPYREFMQKELSIVVSRSYGPGRYDEDFEGRGVKYPAGFVRWTETENLAECVRLMSPALQPRLDVAALTTHRFAFAQAEEAYALVQDGAAPQLGVVLHYAGGEVPADAVVSFPAPRIEPIGRCMLGVIGAGSFARAVLLPELKKIAGVHLHTLVTRRGASAEQAARSFGFANAGTDPALVLDHPDINAVLVATRHDSHAALAARALAAGKPVLVEKPLGLTRNEINAVAAARNGSAAFFQIGFNRRFAPFVVRMREVLAGTSGPRFVVMRVNAGAVPADSWLQGEEGGGRILGEVCHFVDLARFLVGSPIASVRAEAAQAAAAGCDDVSATLRFVDGSLATIAYTALGDTAFSKELIEAYAGGTVVSIDNYRSLRIVRDGRTTTETASNPEKGFRAALAAFAKAVVDGGEAPISETELIETSLATIAVMESLQEGRDVAPEDSGHRAGDE